VDTDNDGVPDGCDRCPGYDDNDDADNDGIPDDCDNCPNTYNPDQEDTDEDGLGDECDPDIDDDGILDDGDGSGIRYDNPCAHLQTINCDDNCPWVYNPDQADTDGDGIGDACETVMGRLAAGAGATASFVLHNGGRSDSVILPAEGGTIVVDLVITHETALQGFEGWIGASAADVISIRASDWTEWDNVLYSYGEPGYTTASSYDFTLMEWYAIYPDGTAEPGTDPEPLLEEEGVEVFTPAVDLAALDGPISTAYGVNLYAAAARVSGLTAETVPAGTTVLLTLTLDVAGLEGTYTLHWLAGALVDESGERVALPDGDLFTIIVEAEHAEENR